MGRILVQQGETVQVGEPLCEVEEGAVAGHGGAGASRASERRRTLGGGPMAIPPEESSEPQANGHTAGRTAVAPPPVAKPEREPLAVAATTQPDGRERFYSPAVMRLARERSVDLAAIQRHRDRRAGDAQGRGRNRGPGKGRSRSRRHGTR